MAHIGFKRGINGFFLATNSFPVNSPMDIDIVFEKGNVRYMNSMLFVNDEVVASDEIAQAEKRYWWQAIRKFLKTSMIMIYSIT